MTKTAWVFPGQGSQVQGMGVDLQETAIAKEKLATAKEILGWDVMEKCIGDEDTLSQTIYTQPCLYTIETILIDLLNAQGQKPDLVAGHSLGEYVALYAAGVFDFATGLKLVKRRSELMSQAKGGKMVALMKFKRDILEEAIENTENVVIANDNSSGQVVVSGEPSAVDELVAKVKARLAVPLKVSGAFHSPLMAEAANEFGGVLSRADFNGATIPVLANVDPTPTTDPQEIKSRLQQQMTGSVRWREIMEQFPTQSIASVVEVGPGKVLSGLIKRSVKGLNLSQVGTLEEIS